MATFSVIFCLAFCSGVSLAQNLPHKAPLDANGDFTLSWDFNDTHITFEMEAKTLGWIGIGLSSGGSMANADIYVGWVKNGEAYITDRRGPSVDQGFPPKDAGQNIALIDGAECDGITTIRFARQLAACEASFDREITGDTLKVIYAWGNSDPVGDDIDSNDYHETNRGAKSLILLDPSGLDDSSFPPGETHDTYDFLMDRFHVPSVDSYYNCRLLKMPRLDDKHHLVKVEPIIQAGNELIVHHILIYHCSSPEDINLADDGNNAECLGSNMPSGTESCRNVLHSWAVGGTAFYYPDHVGYPLKSSTPHEYLILEVHYDNPNLMSDIIDSSGLRFTFTPQLRQFDASIMTVGVMVSGALKAFPPGMESYIDHGECTDQCLEKAMEHHEMDNIKVFAVLLHSHLLGRQMTVKHVRNGTELPHLAQDLSYDFNYQETRVLREERIVRKGDAMQVTCSYNTMDRDGVSLSGLRTSEEMCEAALFYYPSLSVTWCQTAPMLDPFMKYFGFTDYEFPPYYWNITLDDVMILEPEEFAGKTALQNINEMTWNEDSGNELSDAMRKMNRFQLCTMPSLPNPPHVDKADCPPLSIEHTYISEALNCSSPSSGFPLILDVASCPTLQSTTSGSNKVLTCLFYTYLYTLVLVVSLHVC